jgi:hypothetical protein
MDELTLYKLDCGCHYYYKDVIEFTNDNPETKNLLIKSPALPITVYFEFSASGNTEFSVNIKEDISCVELGTEKTICNNDRSCENVSATKIYINPDTPSGGSTIWPARISSPSEKTPTSEPRCKMEYPIKLKSNTNYLVEMNKIEGSKGYLDINAWWFEHEVK